MESTAADFRWSERVLRLLLRYVGTVSLLALVAVVMPQSWMDFVHRQLGLGPLPSEPIVGYLARSLSLFYAVQGLLLWRLSFDVRRYGPVLRFLGLAFGAFGLVLWQIDRAAGLPGWWTAGEGPIVIALGVAMFLLSCRIHSPPGTELRPVQSKSEATP